MPSCLNCKAGFEITSKDEAFYQRMKYPHPTLCPECRLQRKLAYRNENSLYLSTCKLTCARVVSIFPADSPYTVYSVSVWWSDQWDALSYGRNYDFNRPFFEQFKELSLLVPKNNLLNFDCENSEYNNYTAHIKNCYLLFGSWFVEKCLYGNTVLNSVNCVDNLFLDQSQYCYELIDCNNCYETFFSQYSENCSGSMFLFDCKNCKDCICCTNLRDKNNYIFNQLATKEEVDKYKQNLSTNGVVWLRERLDELKKEAIYKFMIGTNNENVLGNFIYNSKNITNSFVIYDSQDITYSYRVSKHQKDSYDIMGCSGGELMYDSFDNDFSHNCGFTMNGDHNSDSYYCSNCFQIDHCFGCEALRHKQYCILNKQYTKEEYEKLLPQILEHMEKTGEWGEFFPMKDSPFCYNETLAQDYFPFTEAEIEAQGLRWRDKEEKVSDVKKNISASSLPDNIKEVTDDILQTAIESEKSKRPFKIMPAELTFYRRYNLPLPHFHPDERNAYRMSLRLPLKLWKRACSKCGGEIHSSYAPDRKEKVYCEKCYLEAVY